MYAAIFSALAAFVRWLLQAGTVKLVLSSLLLGGLGLLFDLVLDLLPSWFDPSRIASAASVLPPAAWYFVDYFNLQLGLSMALAAHATRFLIRRIPFIG